MKKANEERIKKLCPGIKDKSGIYVFYRTDELGINHAYIGLASKSVISRCAEHLSSFQYIDLSIKKHKLFSENNPYGYKLKIECYAPPEQLNELERKYILKYANRCQLKNILSGGQDSGRVAISDTNRKGYRKGVQQGKKQMSKEIANLFEKHLNVSVKKEGNKNQIKALQKLQELLRLHEVKDDD